MQAEGQPIQVNGRVVGVESATVNKKPATLLGVRLAQPPGSEALTANLTANRSENPGRDPPIPGDRVRRL